MLRPSGTNDPMELLVGATYGFERDDHDGYVYARQCVSAALRALGYKRFRVCPTLGPHQWVVMDTRFATRKWWCEHMEQADWLAKVLNEDDEKEREPDA